MKRPDHINQMLINIENSKDYKEVFFENPVIKSNGLQYPNEIERMFLGLKTAGYHKDMLCIFTKTGYECIGKESIIVKL